jgi:hypothetical protein
MPAPPAHLTDHAGRLALRHGPGHAAVILRNGGAFLEGLLLAFAQFAQSVHDRIIAPDRIGG